MPPSSQAAARPPLPCDHLPMTGWIVLAGGALLIGIAIRGVVGERRAAVRGRRRPREDLAASVALLLVLGGVAVLLGLAMLLVFPSGS